MLRAFWFVMLLVIHPNDFFLIHVVYDIKRGACISSFLLVYLAGEAICCEKNLSDNKIIFLR